MKPVCRAVRVLHLFARMNRGGAETWTMDVYRRINHNQIQFDFCVNSPESGAYDEEIRSLGGQIFPLPWRDSPRSCGKLLGAFLRRNPYDIVHSHLYLFSGYTLRVAAGAGVQHRFAHLHTMGDGWETTLKRAIYRTLMKRLLRRHATRVLGCSRAAVANVLGGSWERNDRAAVVYCGTPLEPFERGAGSAGDVRTEIGAAPDTPLIIHVSNFGPAKNPLKVIDVFHALQRRRPEARLVLVGDGQLRSAALEHAAKLGLTEYIYVLGIRADVPQLMLSADVMLMPSVREGVPVTMLEAAAAGLPTVISDLPGIREANDVCGLGTLLAPSAPSEQWADALAAALGRPRLEPRTALERFRDTPFTIDASAREMERLYLAIRAATASH